jgi:hypothetical protein
VAPSGSEAAFFFSFASLSITQSEKSKTNFSRDAEALDRTQEAQGDVKRHTQ